MFIAVTGGTGYLGAHTVKALLDAGHTVRLLVTPAEQNAPVLAALRGLGTVETHVGDVREGTDIAALLEGTDAVIHGAGVVGTDERRTRLMWDVNAYATESVLTTAVDLGLDPIVSVSSYAALFPSPTGIITPETPTAPGRRSYAKTKGYADQVARRLQFAGHPVVVTYPSSVVGPAFHTAVGVTESGWAPMVRARIAPSVRGGMAMVDVRDVAAVHARLMRPGRGPHRYIVGGELLGFDEMVDALAVGLGRPIRRVRMTPGAMRALGRVSDAAGRFVPIADGLTYEAALLLTAATPVDDSATVGDLGIDWRDPRTAIADAVRAHR